MSRLPGIFFTQAVPPLKYCTFLSDPSLSSFLFVLWRTIRSYSPLQKGFYAVKAMQVARVKKLRSWQHQCYIVDMSRSELVLWLVGWSVARLVVWLVRWFCYCIAEGWNRYRFQGNRGVRCPTHSSTSHGPRLPTHAFSCLLERVGFFLRKPDEKKLQKIKRQGRMKKREGDEKKWKTGYWVSG